MVGKLLGSELVSCKCFNMGASLGLEGLWLDLVGNTVECSTVGKSTVSGLGKLEVNRLGSLEGSSDCSNVRGLLGTKLGSTEGLWLVPVEGTVECSMVGKLVGSDCGKLDGSSECSNMGASLGNKLGPEEGLWLGALEGTVECSTVGKMLGSKLGKLDDIRLGTCDDDDDLLGFSAFVAVGAFE